MPVLAVVYRTAGVALDSLLLIRATHLWLRSRGVLSHRTAASLQGLMDEQTTIDVSTTCHLRAPHPRVRVHRVPSSSPGTFATSMTCA